jgi:hypothetical protein
MLALASEAASAVDGNRSRLIGLPILLLDVPIRNEAEFVFVDSLATAATEVLATVPTTDQATLRRLRDRLRPQVDDLDQGSRGDESGASARSASALTNLQRSGYPTHVASVGAASAFGKRTFAGRDFEPHSAPNGRHSRELAVADRNWRR